MINRYRISQLITFIIVASVVGNSLFGIKSATAQTASPTPDTSTTTTPATSASSTTSTGAFNCASVTPGKRDLTNRNNQVIINNMLLNFFTYSSLRDRLRCDPLIVGVLDEAGKPKTTSVYKVAQNLVNLAVLIILIIIGFANILRIKLDTYAAKKALPMLLIGVISANFALPIIRTLVDVSNVLTATIIGSASDLGTKEAFIHRMIETVYIGGATTFNNTIANLDSGSNFGLGSLLALFGLAGFVGTAGFVVLLFLVGGCIILLLLPAVEFFILGMFFVARVYVLVILAAVSPIAFASLGFEPLKARLWGWWWKQIINWVFMVPAVFFLFWLSIQFFNAVGGQMDIGTYIISVFLLTYAIQIPTKLGGSIMGQWNNFVIKPLRDLANAPIQATREGITKSYNRDVNAATLGSIGRRFASPATLAYKGIDRLTGGRLGQSQVGRGLSSLSQRLASSEGARIPVRSDLAVKGFFAGLDSAAEKRDEQSAGRRNAAQAQELGESLGFQGLRGNRRQEFFGFGGVEGRQRAVKAADTLLAELGLSGKKWSELGESEQGTFKNKAEAMRDSGDPLQAAAAYYAHARLGHTDMEEKDHEAYINAAGRNNQVARDALKNSFETEMSNRNGVPYISPSKGGQATDDDTKRARKKMEDQLGRLVEGSEKEQEFYFKMLELLKQSTKDLHDLSKIDESSYSQALATVLLERIDKLPANIREEVVRSGLTSQGAKLGVVEPGRLVRGNAGAKLMAKVKTSAGPNANTSNLRPLLIKNGATDENLRNLKTEDQRAVLATFTHLEETKTWLEELIKRELAEAQLTAGQQIPILRAIMPLLHLGQADVSPELLTDAVFANIPATLRQNIKDRLSVYNNIAENLQTIEASGNRLHVANQVNAVVTGNSSPASPAATQAATPVTPPQNTPPATAPPPATPPTSTPAAP